MGEQRSVEIAGGTTTIVDVAIPVPGENPWRHLTRSWRWPSIRAVIAHSTAA